MPHGDPPEHCQTGSFPTLESINYCLASATTGLQRAKDQNQGQKIIQDWERQIIKLNQEKKLFTADNISSNMVTQKIDYFSIESDRVIGQITFKATENFNPFYYDKNIVSILQLKDRNGVNLIFKQNNLRFSLNQKDETIQFDESAHGQNYLSGQSFVWSNVSTPTPFSPQIQFEITGQITEEIPPPIVTPPIVTPPIVTPPEPTPEIDTSITDNMIIQRLDSFSIINGRAIGQITFTATENFNPFYYDKNITNIIQFKTPNGVNILPFVKQNTLRFTATERIETIQYDEGMNDNTRANVESFVWSGVTQPTAFSKQLKFEIVTAQQGQPIPIPKVQTSGFMGAGVAGAIAGLILIGFIADHKRGK